MQWNKMLYTMQLVEDCKTASDGTLNMGWCNIYNLHVYANNSVIICRFLSGHSFVTRLALWLLTCSSLATHFLLRGAVPAVEEITFS